MEKHLARIIPWPRRATFGVLSFTFGVSRLAFRASFSHFVSRLAFGVSFRVSRFAFGVLRFVSRFPRRVWRFVSRFVLRVSLSLDPTHQEGGVWDSARASLVPRPHPLREKGSGDIRRISSLETRPSPSSAIIITLTFEPYRSYGGRRPGRFSQICARDTRHDRHNDAILQLGMLLNVTSHASASSIVTS